MKRCLWAGALALLPAIAGAAGYDEAAVKAACAQEWGNDYSMQAYCIGERKKGFEQVQSKRPGLDGDMANALTNCEAEWQQEWSMVAYCLAEQEKGRAEIPARLSGLPEDVASTIHGTCSADWPGDFAMQAYCTGEQAAGWRAINQ